MPRTPLIPPAELRRLSQKLVDLQSRIDLVEQAMRATQLSNSSIEGGSIVIRDPSGIPRGYVGLQPDGTTAVRHVNGPPPPRPNTPDVESIIAGVRVSWNGEFSTGTRPHDFAFVQIHVSGAGENFIPGPSNLVGTLSQAGSFPVVPVTGQQWVRLIAVSTSGKESEPSFVNTGTPGQVVEGDILDGIVTETKLAEEAVSEAKLAAGAVTETKVADDAISTPKLVAGAVQAEKIATGAVLAEKIASGAVITEKLDALAVTADKIAANAIEAGHITAGAVEAEKLAAELVVAGTPGENRVQITEAEGIEQWLEGERTIWIPPNGNAEFQGQVRSGTPFQHFMLLPMDVQTSFPRMHVLDDNSTVRVAMYYQTDTLWLRRETITAESWEIGAVKGGQLTIGPGQASFIYMSDANSAQLGGWYVNGDGSSKFLGRRADGSELGAWDVQPTGDCFLTADRQLIVRNRGNGGGDMRFEGDNNIWFVAGGDCNFESNAVFLRNNKDPDDDEFGEIAIFANGEMRITVAGGTPFGPKPFVIDHPDDPENRWLVHGCTESPMAGVEYWGEVEIVDGAAVVELPSYFEGLTLEQNRQVQLTPIDELCMVAATRIANGRFTIKCTGPDGTKVAWLVKAERRDAAGFDVEPLKSEVSVRGDGPYRYLVGKKG